MSSPYSNLCKIRGKTKDYIYKYRCPKCDSKLGFHSINPVSFIQLSENKVSLYDLKGCPICERKSND